MQSTICYTFCQLVQYSYLLIFVLFTMACQSKNETAGKLSHESASPHTGHGTPMMPAGENKEIHRLQTEVLAMHDELMSGMDELMQLKRKSKQTLLVLDSIHKANPEKEPGSAEKQRLEAALAKLSQTDEAMMNWMRKYDQKMQGMSEAEKQKYLQEEKAKLAGIKEDMRQSMETTRQLLKKP